MIHSDAAIPPVYAVWTGVPLSVFRFQNVPSSPCGPQLCVVDCWQWYVIRFVLSSLELYVECRIRVTKPPSL